MDVTGLEPHARPIWFERRFLCLTAGVVAFVLCAGVGMVRANRKTVDLLVDDVLITHRTYKKTVGEFLFEVGVDLGPADEIEPSLDSVLEKHHTIRVVKAVAVEIEADGQTRQIMTTQKTVAGLVLLSGIDIGPLDRIVPEPTAPVLPNMSVEITRVTEETVTSVVAIPFSTQKREDSSLESGLTKQLQKGADGQKEEKYLDVYEDGIRISSSLVDSKVLKEPVTSIVAYGTAGSINRGGETVRFAKAYEMVATAYSPGPECTGKWSDGYTSIGMKAGFGVVAVDPKVIPMRSRLYIDGYGYAIAGDTGSAIKGNRIDLGYETYDEALRWGRRKVKVYLLN